MYSKKKNVKKRKLKREKEYEKMIKRKEKNEYK